MNQDYQQQEIFEIQDKWNPLLIQGCKENHTEKIKTALKNKAEINWRDKNGWDALVWACNNGSLDAVLLLFQKDVLQFYSNLEKYFSQEKIEPEKFIDQNYQQNSKEKNPLLFSSLNGHWKICSLLISQGFSWLVYDDQLNNCFHYACSSNSVQTVKVFLQIGVSLWSKNYKKNKPVSLTSDQQIIDLLWQYKFTKQCKISNEMFKKNDIKYLCQYCEQFVSKKTCQISFLKYSIDIQLPFIVQCLCFECQQIQLTLYQDLNAINKERNYDKLISFFEKNQKELTLLDVDIIHNSKQLILALQKEIEIKEILKQSNNIENYKEIKNIVFNLQEIFQYCQKNHIQIQQELIQEINSKISTLEAEWNIRHFLTYFEEGEITKSLQDYVQQLYDEAVKNKVQENYLQKAIIILSRINLVLEARELLTLFKEYPIREYPMDPIWDKKRKIYLDPVTKKPLDPKKPQILPIDPPKKSKKKKTIEFQIPEWAQIRLDFLKKVQWFQEIMKNYEAYFDQSFKQDSEIEIKRMLKENKYRNRIELDQKLIEEIHSKKKK